jgi:hypothetical protein
MVDFPPHTPITSVNGHHQARVDHAGDQQIHLWVMKLDFS